MPKVVPMAATAEEEDISFWKEIEMSGRFFL
jgi:hypothetical protein